MKTLNMSDWRRVFQEQMQVAKPNDVWSLKMDQQLDFNHLGPGWVQVLQEHAHARFTCSQCYHSWSSHRVVILFHMYWERYERRGWAWMRVFRQQCHECSSEKHEEPQFTETDVASAIHRLILDIRDNCYGEYVDRSELSEVVWDTEHDGHIHQECEACQMGLHRKQRGKPENAVHHGRPQGAMQYGNPQPPACVVCAAFIVRILTAQLPAFLDEANCLDPFLSGFKPCCENETALIIYAGRRTEGI
ncbi:receptor-transporting protein 2-like [Eublepharis macularius]|uniref:Receptor-transporting protein 2-like n=1 Tax=Eublepharis macularius TaxID=481883 RepID=A0AA97JIW6_EUBMA|nr:receptor-transporting protein 2-like [Eublepharis macularius]